MESQRSLLLKDLAFGRKRDAFPIYYCMFFERNVKFWHILVDVLNDEYMPKTKMTELHEETP